MPVCEGPGRYGADRGLGGNKPWPWLKWRKPGDKWWTGWKADRPIVEWCINGNLTRNKNKDIRTSILQIYTGASNPHILAMVQPRDSSSPYRLSVPLREFKNYFGIRNASYFISFFVQNSCRWEEKKLLNNTTDAEVDKISVLKFKWNWLT